MCTMSNNQLAQEILATRDGHRHRLMIEGNKAFYQVSYSDVVEQVLQTKLSIFFLAAKKQSMDDYSRRHRILRL